MKNSRSKLGLVLYAAAEDVTTMAATSSFIGSALKGGFLDGSYAYLMTGSDAWR